MYVSQPAADLETAEAIGLRAAAQRLFATVDREEIRIVQRSVAFARRWHLLKAARIITRLGNGWLYPIAAALLLLTFQSAARCIVAATGGVTKSPS